MNAAIVDRFVHWVLDRNSRHHANWLTKRIFMWGVRYFIRRGQVESVELVDDSGRRW